MAGERAGGRRSRHGRVLWVSHLDKASAALQDERGRAGPTAGAGAAAGNALIDPVQLHPTALRTRGQGRGGSQGWDRSVVSPIRSPRGKAVPSEVSGVPGTSRSTQDSPVPGSQQPGARPEAESCHLRGTQTSPRPGCPVPLPIKHELPPLTERGSCPSGSLFLPSP
ncbi:hypothetical protein AV530_013611 [Patagioenas fasciata monilis]|uniref:Uncharacterized protein n=1 Tax=Patagioenas fasciata monilis TaxID=372326 RepID=A0A1V4JQ22_PATFA|nr:hypothetical protein AV530_013611 [Patagioenas fasciata monilis]